MSSVAVGLAAARAAARIATRFSGCCSHSLRIAAMRGGAVAYAPKPPSTTKSMLPVSWPPTDSRNVPAMSRASAIVDTFTTEVLSEWYSSKGTWCQGAANLMMSLLVGVDCWQRVRDFMNSRTRLFRRDPPVGAFKTVDEIDYLLHLLRRPPSHPFAIYVELDCWNSADAAAAPAKAKAS